MNLQIERIWDRVGEVMLFKAKGKGKKIPKSPKKKIQKKERANGRQRKAPRIIIAVAALWERTGLLIIDKKTGMEYNMQEIGTAKTQARASSNIYKISQQNHEGNYMARLRINDGRKRGGKNKRSGRDERYFQPICS